MTIKDELEDDMIFGGTNTIENTVMVRNGVLSLSGAAFKAIDTDINDTHIDADEGWIKASADGIYFVCPIQLPEGATITEINVFGNNAAKLETFALMKIPLDYTSDHYIVGGGAGTNISTAMVPTTHQIVDNARYHYFIATSSLDTDDMIYGMQIKYKN